MENQPNLPAREIFAKTRPVHHSVVAERMIEMGLLIEEGSGDELFTDNRFAIDYADLRKQILICGTRGTGKLNFCLYLLRMLWEKHSIPFLVVEPSSAEYRSPMMMVDSFRGSTRIYTLGDRRVAPLRLNALAIQSGTRVSTHIDSLIAVLSSSILMSADAKRLMRTTLRAAYVARGWDIEDSSNGSSQPGQDIKLIPTLDDLNRMADADGDGSTDCAESTRAAKIRLKEVLSELSTWPTRDMFASDNFTKMDDLFKVPTVIEMREIFDDTQKGFFLNLLLLGLQEHCRGRSIDGQKPISHTLIIEDGHRLLNKHIFSQCLQDRPLINAGAHLAARFLAELSGYAQGVIVSSQSPAELVPSILANIYLKIILRLGCAEDIAAVAGGCLTGMHRRKVGSLGRGRAIAYSNRMNLPYYLRPLFDKIVDAPKAETLEESDHEVRKQMRRFKLNR